MLIFEIQIFGLSWPQGYKTFFMPYSAEHEISSAVIKMPTNIIVLLLSNVEHVIFPADDNLIAIWLFTAG